MSANAASAIDLLKSLAGGGSSTRVRPATGFEPQSSDETTRTGSFAELLAKARSGQINSNLPVSVSSNAGVQLSPDQLQRLSVAADMAQAAGATRAMVRIDGQNLMLDVGSRQITGAINSEPGQVVTGIDAVLEVPASGPPSVKPVGQSVPTSGLPLGINQSLLAALGA